MAIKKIAVIDFIAGEGDNSILPVEKIAGNEVALARFRKVADSLREEQARAKAVGKQLSPKVDDFLYAHCIMMHAAEAALINQDTGEPLLSKAGEPVRGQFVVAKDAKGRDTVRWDSPDGVLPYRNGNGDIFPEEDLLKAHKEWVGKPLCRDHVSSTVDGIRGIVVDTYYDPKFKRVHALFALDRKNYADLARKVEAGYATSVSMGTAVGRSICSECSNVATTEAEYCHHVKTKQCHGEVNKDLSPIELSIVVTGADPKAKIMTVLAALKDYESHVNKVAQGEEDPSVLKNIMSGLNSMAQDLDRSEPRMTEEVAVDKIVKELSLLKDRDVSEENRALAEKFLRKTLKEAGKSIEDLEPDNRRRVLEAAQSASIDLEEKNQLLSERLKDLLRDEPKSVGLDVQPGMVEHESLPTNELVDSSGYGLAEPGLGPGGIEQAPINTISSLYMNGAGEEQVGKANLANKIAELKKQITELERKINSEESVMSFADLMKKPLERKAYWQGTEEPTPGKPQYPLMGDQDKVRENDDKHMNQDGSLGGSDGLAPGDEQAKKLVQRAELEERMARRAQLLREAQGKSLVETKEGPKVFDSAKGEYDAKDGKVAAKKDKDEEEDEKEDKKSKKDDDKKSDKKDKKDDKDSKKEDKKSKKDDKDDDEKSEKEDKKDDKDSKKKEKKAYFQGTEEPKPGQQQYPLMGDQDKVREKDDKHMLQDGNMGGADGLVPGDEQAKKELQRMAGKLGAKLYKGASPAESRWEFIQNGKPLFSVTASAAYGKFLDDHFTKDSTYSDLFHSKDWGARVMKMLRNDGLTATAKELGVELKKTAAEPAMPGAPAAPAAEPAMPEPAPAPEEPVEGEKSPEEKLEDVSRLVEEIEATLEEVKNLAGTKATPEEEGLAEVDVAAGAEPLPAGDEAAPVVAKVSDRDLLQVFALLNDTCNELSFIKVKASEGRVPEGFYDVAQQAIHDAKVAHTESRKVVAQYAKQLKVATLKARAEKREKLVAKAMGGDAYMALAPEAEMMALDPEDKEFIQEEVESALGEHNEAMHQHDEHAEEELLEDLKEEVEGLEEEHKGLMEMDCGDDMDMNMDMEYDSMDAMARKAWRENLVKEAMDFDNDVYLDQRKGGGDKIESYDLTVKDDLDKVEVLHEVHEKMEEVATKPLGKVREAAKQLDKWMKIAGIDSSKLDMLVAEGAVDGEVAKYWKDFYGQVDGGKDFAAGLVKEFEGSKKKATASGEELETRIRRAYSLGLEAQKKGIIGPGSSDLERYVDTLKTLPEGVFNNFKEHVAQYKVPQGLISAPLVGITDKEAGLDSNLNKTASAENPLVPSFENLSKIFS